jgi:site-specific DNA-methyltransferase (adenine-specific)
LDISKAIDKKLGAEREIVEKRKFGGRSGDSPTAGASNGGVQGGFNLKDNRDVTSPATPEAQEWEGWGTALKPANEPIVLARKPLSEKTVAENVLKWGTGGINIDGCRIESGGEHKRAYQPTNHERGVYGKQTAFQPSNKEGRFPANVILDEEAGALLDQQSGSISYGNKSGGYSYSDRRYAVQGFVKDCKPKAPSNYGDSGGAGRFFYCAKASKKERGEGNNHPTVKPIKLIEYLITLITPPNGTVLDPFLGSGTTAIAALNTGRYFIGIEKEKKYFDIANERIANHTIRQRLKFA